MVSSMLYKQMAYTCKFVSYFKIMKSSGYSKVFTVLLTIATFSVLLYDGQHNNSSSTVPAVGEKQLPGYGTVISLEDRENVSMSDMKFKIRSSFQLPVPHSTLPIDVLLRQLWIKDLKEILSTIDPHSGSISLTTSDLKFQEVLLNWLIASTLHITPQLSHPLILCMDKSVYDLLKSHNITSIYTPPESFVDKKTNDNLKKHVAFTTTQILRLTVMRLLNHWGYNAANYDADAYLVKNPEPLYYDTHRESNLIASYGHFPSEIRQLWGVTLCAGVFMIKSAPVTELFWEKMNSVLPNSYNDQARLNNALLKLDVKWGERQHLNSATTDWRGTTAIGLTVTILSGQVVCRQLCSKANIDKYYVWHKGGSGKEGKKKYALRGGLWYLSSDWETLTEKSTLVGVDWLRSISI